MTVLFIVQTSDLLTVSGPVVLVNKLHLHIDDVRFRWYFRNYNVDDGGSGYVVGDVLDFTNTGTQGGKRCWFCFCC